jgi:hypothetical protein
LLFGARKSAPASKTLKSDRMLYTIAIVLIILWLLGFVTGTMGGLIHILLVLAVIAILLRVISGRNTV